jgi:hypothetical protein
VSAMNKLSLIATTAVVSTGGAFAVDAAFTSAHGGAFHHHRAFHHARGFVHGEFVVPARDNTFKTITIDRGTITGVDGSTIHLREGTKDATYKTIDVTLGSDDVVVIDGRTAPAGDLKAGDKAQVTHRPKRTVVFAFERR